MDAMSREQKQCPVCENLFVPRHLGNGRYVLTCSSSCGHLIRWRNNLLARFLGNVIRSDSCWNWQGKKIRTGYGSILINSKPILTHRFAWELKNGPIPDGLYVLHKCDNPSCVNPDHLFLGTHADNAADRVSKGRQARGVKHGRAKHTEEQVSAFKKAIANRGTKIIKEVAAEFGIPKGVAGAIARGELWKHVAVAE